MIYVRARSRSLYDMTQLFIGSGSEDQLIPLLGCESFDCFNPIGLPLSRDGRMYICELRDTLTVREIDHSQPELSLHIGPEEDLHENIYARVCSDDGIVVLDCYGNITKYSKDGDFMWRIDKISPNTTFCLDSSDLLYCATPDQVKVYLPSGAFSHVLVSDLKHPTAIATDRDNNIHVGFSSSIRVFSAKGKMIREYGHAKLGELGGLPSNIAISRDNPQLVVATEYDTDDNELFVFNSTGSLLYTVTGVTCVVDIAFGPDNSLWVAERAPQCEEATVLHVKKLFHQLPPPLSYLCELSILPHLNELPVSLLPPRLARLFEKWTELVTVEVRHRSFTDYPSKSKLISETIKLKVEPNPPEELVQWLVSKKMDLEFSTIEFEMQDSTDESVDFVVSEC